MHPANVAFWDYCQNKYSSYCHKVDGRILEVGSCYINGSVRDHFSNFSEYIGVDWRAGKNVDKVCYAHEMEFENKFDVVISASMLEHDPHWEKSIPKIVECMADDGILFLSWGAALNKPHCHDTADDGLFHNLQAGYVLKALGDLGMYLHEFHYEGNQFPKIVNMGKGMGEVCLVAFKDEKYAIGDKHIDKLIKEDVI